MPWRYCKRCDQTLPLFAFNRFKDGHQWWCRECFRAYFRKRGDLHRQQAGANKEERKERAHRYVLEHLQRHPCVDCDERDPIVLKFVHVGTKGRNVASLVQAGARAHAIDAEIAKCEVVCRNCHRRRTLARLGCERGRQESLASQKEFVKRNIRWLYELLESSACVDCGVTDFRVLEFDHVGPKRGAVMSMAWNGFGRATLEAEVAQCEVRCSNCHCRKTAERGNYFRHRASLAAKDASLARE